MYLLFTLFTAFGNKMWAEVLVFLLFIGLLSELE